MRPKFILLISIIWANAFSSAVHAEAVLFPRDTSKDIQLIQSLLQSGKRSVSGILEDTSYLYLHANSRFRNLIKENSAESIVTLVSTAEPGTRLEVKGGLINQSHEPVKKVLIYVYQTSNKGWYSDTAAHISMNEGDRKHARLFGYLKTDEQGKFEIHTIRPVGYPKSTLPAHIHIECYDAKGQSLLISELLFDDDARLTAEQRKRSLDEGFYIAKPTTKSDGSEEVGYEIIVKE